MCVRELSVVCAEKSTDLMASISRRVARRASSTSVGVDDAFFEMAWYGASLSLAVSAHALKKLAPAVNRNQRSMAV